MANSPKYDLPLDVTWDDVRKAPSDKLIRARRVGMWLSILIGAGAMGTACLWNKSSEEKAIPALLPSEPVDPWQAIGPHVRQPVGIRLDRPCATLAQWASGSRLQLGELTQRLCWRQDWLGKSSVH